MYKRGRGRFRGNGNNKRHDKNETEYKRNRSHRNKIDELEHDGTCFVVVDVVGNEEDVEIKSECSEMTDDEEIEIESYDVGASCDKYVSREKRNKISTERNVEIVDFEMKMKSSQDYMREEKQYKRRSGSPLTDPDRKRRKLHTKYQSSRSPRRRAFHERHFREQRNNLKVNDALQCQRENKRTLSPYFNDRKYRESHDDSKYYHSKRESRASERHSPLLMVNGKPEDRDSRTVKLVQGSLSPVSDRSMSPFADNVGGVFTPEKTEDEHFDNTDNQTNDARQVDVHSNINASIVSHEDIGFQNGFVFPAFPYQNNVMPYRNHFPYDVVENNGRFQGSQNFYSTDIQVRPPFYGPMSYQHFPVQHASFQVSNSFRNNRPYTARIEVPTESFECFHVTREMISSQSAEIQNKVMPIIYRALITDNREQFSPDDIIQLLLHHGQTRLQFDTTDDLVQLLKRNENKFEVEDNDSAISPKTDVEICHAFTTNPGIKHDCMDLHICKYYLLGDCPWQHCKFSHRLSSKHNVKVRNRKGLKGLSEDSVKKLIRGFHSRNTSTTPLICKFYNNEGGCQKSESCNHLHLCTHFINGDCKFGSECRRSHDIDEKQPKVTMERHGIFLKNSNHDRIISLLKATLHHGEVKLKRELSKGISVDSNISNTVKTVNRLVPSSTEAWESGTVSNSITSVKTLADHLSTIPANEAKENDEFSTQIVGTNSLESNKSQDNFKNRNKIQDNLNRECISKEHDEKIEKYQTEIYQQISLPEFIPLETDINTDVEQIEDTVIHNPAENNTLLPLHKTNVEATVEVTSPFPPVLEDTSPFDSIVHKENTLSSPSRSESPPIEVNIMAGNIFPQMSVLPPWKRLCRRKEDFDCNPHKDPVTETKLINSGDDTVGIDIKDNVHLSKSTLGDDEKNNEKVTDQNNVEIYEITVDDKVMSEKLPKQNETDVNEREINELSSLDKVAEIEIELESSSNHEENDDNDGEFEETCSHEKTILDEEKPEDVSTDKESAVSEGISKEMLNYEETTGNERTFKVISNHKETVVNERTSEELSISSDLSGKVEENFIKRDDDVKEGTVLASILFEIRSKQRCVRVRRYRDGWQIYVTSGSDHHSNDGGLIEEVNKCWENTETEEAEILEKVYNMIAGFDKSKSVENY